MYIYAYILHACKYLKEKSYQCKSKQGHLCEEYPQSIIVNPKLINTTYLEKWGTLYTLFAKHDTFTAGNFRKNY